MSEFTAATAARRTEWRSDTWGTLRCISVWNETRDIKTFLLAPADGSRISFDPGQFLTFRAAIDGVPVERSYTISSSAAVDRTVSITVKRKENGLMSGYLHDNLVPGSTISAFGPAGRFGPVEFPAERYTLISAGSGVTPMLSFVSTAADLGVPLNANFVHISRTPRDIISRNILQAFARRMPDLKLHLLTSQPGARSKTPGGRLTREKLTDLVGNIEDHMVMCCGPEGFMATMRDAARDLGVPEDRYTEESFDFSEDNDPMADDGPIWRITFARSGKSFDCPAGTTILRAAKLAGIPMPASCSKGVCGTCKCAKLSGDVTMEHAGGIRQREIDRGLILPCSSKPLADIVLDR